MRKNQSLKLIESNHRKSIRIDQRNGINDRKRAQQRRNASTVRWTWRSRTKKRKKKSNKMMNKDPKARRWWIGRKGENERQVNWPSPAERDSQSESNKKSKKKKKKLGKERIKKKMIKEKGRRGEKERVIQALIERDAVQRRNDDEWEWEERESNNLEAGSAQVQKYQGKTTNAKVNFWMQVFFILFYFLFYCYYIMFNRIYLNWITFFFEFSLLISCVFFLEWSHQV